MKAAIAKLKKSAAVDDYDIEGLDVLSGPCKKMAKNAGIHPEEAAEHLSSLLNCLYFDSRKIPEDHAEVKSCLRKYRENKRELAQKKNNPNNNAAKDISHNSEDKENEEDGGDASSEKEKGDDSAGSQDEKTSNRVSSENPRSEETTISKQEGNGIGKGKGKEKEKKLSKKEEKGRKKKEAQARKEKKESEAAAKKRSSVSEIQQRPKDKVDHRRNRSSFSSGEAKSTRDKLKEKPVDIPPDLFICESPSAYFSAKIKIGQGGFGEVMTAKDKATGTTVAIKALRKRFSSNSQSILNEIENLKACSHPNIVNYVRSYLYHDKVFLIMEYCDGGSLHKLLSNIDLSEGQMSIICKQILSGLAYLHEQNKIHRDIKSENILLNINGVVKLADLGLIAELESEDDSKTSIAGSRYWMAPEMINRRPYGTKVDIWSLGAVCMEMAEKHPPYAHYRSLKAMFTTATKGAPPLKKKKWSKEFRTFISRCFEMNPDKRASAMELLEDEWITKKAAPTSKLTQAIGIVFLGNSIKMNGF